MNYAISICVFAIMVWMMVVDLHVSDIRDCMVHGSIGGLIRPEMPCKGFHSR